MTKGKAKTTAKAPKSAIWNGPQDLRELLQPVDALHQDPRNPRKHDDRNLEAIRASLFEFGQLRPLVVQRSTMQVVAGNGTLQAAKLAGWTHVAALVADMSDEKARAFSIADNRTAELAAWDADNLAAALADPALDALLGATGFSADEIQKLIGDTAGGLHVEPDPATRATSATVRSGGSIAGDPEDDDEGDDDDGDGGAAAAPAAADADDELPELPKEPKTKAGDVWICGEHEVLCADSFGDDTAKFLGRRPFDAVVTDPPYAIFGSSTGVSTDIADDRMVRPFFASLVRLLGASLRPFAHAYVFTDWRSWSSLWESTRGSPLSVRNMLVWNKRGGLGANYVNAHELVAFMHRQPNKRGAHQSSDERGTRVVPKPNVLDFNRPTGEERPHHASKPVQLLQQLIENSTDAGELVLEPFGGGGSTLVACEKTRRRCRLVEIEPKWCDVIVARWERLTGRKAERRPAK